MTRAPEVYNARPYNYEPQEPQRVNVLPFRTTFIETVSEEYYETCSTSKVITFDSGEHSLRREYIQKTLIYLIQVKGIPTVVLSSLDDQYTNYYLTKIPYNLKNKVLDLGLFHTYNKIVKHLRAILQDLFIDIRYRATIDYFVFSLKTLESKLIKELNKLGLVVILDRSLISTYIYNNILYQKSQQSLSNLLNLQALRSFKTYASFFIHSMKSESVTKRTLLSKGSIYDSFDFLNYNIRSLIPKLKENIPNLIQVPQHTSFEENMKLIRDSLREL